MRLNNIWRLRNAVWQCSKRLKSTGPLELTQVRYNVERGNYANVEGKDVKFFESIIGESHVVQENLDSYNIDFLRSVRGDSKVVLQPNCVEQISAIMKYCNERRLAVCPQGGNTGLVGGSVPVCDEIVICLQRLNKILSIDEITGIAQAEAGCILQNLDEKAREKGLVVPLDLGAKASCHIGGNVSTNAGGLRVLRYGNLHGSVLGLEVVLANGEVLNLMSDFKKDNTGYHLKHLFIGAEGTLGIVTKVSLLCPPEPAAVHVAFLGLNSFDDVLKTFRNARIYLGEILSACELIDEHALNASVEHYNLNAPIQGFPFYMLIETSGSDAAHDLEKFNKFLEVGMENGEIVDGSISGQLGKIKDLWNLREFVPTALVRDGYCFKYDISLPLREFYNIVNVLQHRVGGLAKRVCGYGHLGDSNLHLNVTCDEYSPELHRLIEPFVYEHTAKVKGSISAEHGIGFAKTKYLHYSKSPEAIAKMKQMKKLFDPNGILNPYKVIN